MIGDNPHAFSVRLILFAAELLKFFDNRPHQTNFEHIRISEFCRSDTFQTRAVIDIFLFQLFKHAVRNLAIRHKDVIANLHETAAIAVRVAKFTKFGVMRRTKIIKHLAIRPAWVANWRCFRRTIAAPPVFAAIVVKNSLTILDTARIPSLFRANICLLRGKPGFFVKPRPHSCRLGVFWNIVPLITDITGHVYPRHIDPDNLREEFPHPFNLLLFEVVAHAPVAKHLKKGRMTIIANILDILCAQACLAIDDALAIWVWLSK